MSREFFSLNVKLFFCISSLQALIHFLHKSLPLSTKIVLEIPTEMRSHNQVPFFIKNSLWIHIVLLPKQLHSIKTNWKKHIILHQELQMIRMDSSYCISILYTFQSTCSSKLLIHADSLSIQVCGRHHTTLATWSQMERYMQIFQNLLS